MSQFFTFLALFPKLTEFFAKIKEIWSSHSEHSKEKFSISSFKIFHFNWLKKNIENLIYKYFSVYNCIYCIREVFFNTFCSLEYFLKKMIIILKLTTKFVLPFLSSCYFMSSSLFCYSDLSSTFACFLSGMIKQIFIATIWNFPSKKKNIFAKSRVFFCFCLFIVLFSGFKIEKIGFFFLCAVE